MRKDSRYWMVPFVCALIGGCGGLPDLIVDAARESTKAAVEEAVQGVIDDVTGEILNPDTMADPLLEGDE
jgi:hypothetical protein